VLLARLAGLTPDLALALSLAKRVRELAAGPCRGLLLPAVFPTYTPTRSARPGAARLDALRFANFCRNPARPIILAAGRGSRLAHPRVPRFSQVLLKFGGITLLGAHLRCLSCGGGYGKVVNCL